MSRGYTFPKAYGIGFTSVDTGTCIEAVGFLVALCTGASAWLGGMVEPGEVRGPKTVWREWEDNVL